MIRLDHSGKDESKGMRGGSAKAGDVDAVWLLTKITDTSLRLECSYTRPQLDTKLLKITRNSEPLRHELEDADAITTPEAKIRQLIWLCDNDNLPRRRQPRRRPNRRQTPRNEDCNRANRGSRQTAKKCPQPSDT
jgi:hypothetical protein